MLLPVRSPAPWLNFTLESLKNQTIDHWRLVLIMDGASDEVAEVVHAAGIENLVVEAIPAKSGLVAALNRGLEICSADYIARIDSDDLADPERLDRQVEFMEENPTCGVSGTAVRYIDEVGNVVGSGPISRTDCIRRLRWRNAISHPTALIRREAVTQVEGYCVDARHAEDFDLWLRLAAAGWDVKNLDEVLGSYRVSSNQVTATAKFDRVARRQIWHSRLALAKSRNESATMALVRQSIWLLVNSIRGR